LLEDSILELGRIDLIISFVPIVVFIAFFGHGQCKNEEQGGQKREKEADLEYRYELGDRCEEVEQVEEIPKLLIQHQRDESYYRIFLVSYRVRGLLAKMRVFMKHSISENNPSL
jgi:hypothetical protein